MASTSEGSTGPDGVVAVDQGPLNGSTKPSRRPRGAPEPQETRSGFMAGVEILRGIAASTVVVEHTWALTTSPTFWGWHIIEGFGEWGVVLFFLLSGYLLCDYFWRPRQQWSIRTFWTRRFFRIAPAYYVNVGLLFLFFAPYQLLFSSQGAKQVAANATFTHWLFPATSSSLNVNGALWTLTIEMLLYLVLPLMAPPMRRRPLVTFAVLMVIGLAYRFYSVFRGGRLLHLYFSQGSPGDGIAHIYLVRQFIGLLPLFAIGMLARWVHLRAQQHFGDRLPQPRFSLAVLAATLVPSTVALEWVERGTNYQHPFVFIFYEPILVVLMLPALLYAAQAVAARPRLGSRIGLWLGERSYSLYLWHFAIILAVFGRGAEVQPPHMSHVLARVLLVAVLSLLASAVSYTAIEKPARLYGRKLASHRFFGRPAPPGLNVTIGRNAT